MIENDSVRVWRRRKKSWEWERMKERTSLGWEWERIKEKTLTLDWECIIVIEKCRGKKKVGKKEASKEGGKELEGGKERRNKEEGKEEKEEKKKGKKKRKEERNKGRKERRKKKARKNGRKKGAKKENETGKPLGSVNLWCSCLGCKVFVTCINPLCKQTHVLCIVVFANIKHGTCPFHQYFDNKNLFFTRICFIDTIFWAINKLLYCF